eukprot:9658917-Lingulodinium_polyedra.AAC.1
MFKAKRQVGSEKGAFAAACVDAGLRTVAQFLAGQPLGCVRRRPDLHPAQAPEAPAPCCQAGAR